MIIDLKEKINGIIDLEEKINGIIDLEEKLKLEIKLRMNMITDDLCLKVKRLIIHKQYFETEQIRITIDKLHTYLCGL